MANLVKAASRDEISQGQGKCVDISGKAIALFNIGGDFYAMDNTCVHRGGPLAEGSLEEHVVTCPWHGWKYDCKTGQSLNAPGKAVASYKVEIRENDVMVDIG
ncbi:MAG: non-heme iron oxygenase ferredoxin subunit [Acidobacteriota bacterium]